MDLPGGVQEPDSLSTLEERIQQAVVLVERLRAERDEAIAARNEALAGVQTRDRATAGEIARLSRELEALRAERQQVRGRIEKLLGQIDAIGAG